MNAGATVGGPKETFLSPSSQSVSTGFKPPEAEKTDSHSTCPLEIDKNCSGIELQVPNVRQRRNSFSSFLQPSSEIELQVPKNRERRNSFSFLQPGKNEVNIIDGAKKRPSLKRSKSACDDLSEDSKNDRENSKLSDLAHFLLRASIAEAFLRMTLLFLLLLLGY